MTSFILYDIIFLVVFSLITGMFLYRRRKNLQRQGLLYLYRTKVGIRFIEWTSSKYPNLLKRMQYVVVGCGFILMVSMVYLLIKFSWVYIASPFVAEAIKIPIIMPLVPYLPEIFKLDLPSFYFTYWIIIIAIIAIPHEFAHGIFASLNKVKIHATGFGFLGPFLAAFVEPDEKEMEKIKKFPQMSILAAGTFANILMTILFGVIFLLFFVTMFSPAGVLFNTYASSLVPISNIVEINGVNISSGEGILNLIDENSDYTQVRIEGQSGEKFFVSSSNFKALVESNSKEVIVILDSPAFQNKLSGAITSIDDVPTRSLEELSNVIDSHKPGDEVKIKTIGKNGSEMIVNLKFGENEGKAFLGIGTLLPVGKGINGWIYGVLSKIKSPFIYYDSVLGDLGLFIYDLLWWIVLVNISVALANMLPLGIFDGGKFFYLTVWGITGRKKIAEIAFKISTYSILILVAVLMIRWIFIFI